MASERRTSGVVTPEAVLLQFETAGVASRGIARLVDLTVQALIAWALVYVVVIGAVLLGRFGSEDDAGALAAGAVVVVFVTVFCYPIGCEWLLRGRTVGKAMVGLRVLTSEGAPVRLRHAATRNIVGVPEVLALPFIAVLSTALSPAHQRLGDMAAGTIVVRQRTGTRSAIALVFPPPHGWEAYAASLDVSAMTAEQYHLVRSFLTRVLMLRPRARQRLAARLANALSVTVRHRPPPQLGPELFLVCVVAAYQVRHGLGGLAAPARAPALNGPPASGGPPPYPPAGWQASSGSVQVGWQ